MKPRFRVGVELTTVRYEAAGKPVVSIPREPMALTAAEQNVPPRAADLTPEAFETLQVGWDSVIVVIPLHHAMQPVADNGNGLVPPTHQGLPEGQQRSSHALLRREANDLKPALPVLTATVCEPEEVEGFRSSLTSAPSIRRGKPSKLNQPRLLGVQGQSEFGKAFLHCGQETPCGLLALESEHTIIGVANDDDIAPSMLPTPLMRP